MALKQELIIKQLDHLWREHPAWSFGKLASVLMGLNDIERKIL